MFFEIPSIYKQKTVNKATRFLAYSKTAFGNFLEALFVNHSGNHQHKGDFFFRKSSGWLEYVKTEQNLFLSFTAKNLQG